MRKIRASPTSQYFHPMVPYGLSLVICVSLAFRVCLWARLISIVVVKKSIKCLKQCLFFCQKSAKIMLIFLKSARGLHKNAHFFPIFFKHRILHFSDFQLHFSTTKWQSTLLSYLCLGWLTSIAPR